MKPSFPAFALAALGPFISSPAYSALVSYTPDAATRYLYHFDEAAGSSAAVNAGTTGFQAIAYDGTTYAGDGIDQPTSTTVLGTPSYAGFGNAANISASHLGLGVDRDGSGAFMMGDNAPVSPDQFPDHSTLFGDGNAFTLEAMVNVASITGANRHIISTDNNSGNADRGFQFRINSTGALEFNFIGVATTAVTVPIPTIGDHAFVANEWFHTAMVYDGANATFYWTRVDPTYEAANLVGGPLAEAVDINDDMVLVIGNEGRATGAPASSEGLQGQIDEVRISSVARQPTEFIFVPEPSSALLAAAGLAVLLRRRRVD